MIVRTSDLSILWIYAHPDDESFGNAGTMLLAKSSNKKIGLICATRGENGEISNPELGTPEILGAVREQELRRAMNVVGLDELRLLEYRDSGMAGTPQNEDPRTLNKADETGLVASLVAHIRELRPSAVITFGPDGVYGHPDHIRIGAATDTAVELAAGHEWPALGKPWQTDALYHVAAPREAFIEARKKPNSPFKDMPESIFRNFGSPAAEITHWLDVSSMIEGKIEAIGHHVTQLAEGDLFSDTASPEVRSWIGVEQFRLVRRFGDADSDPLDALYQQHPGTREF